MSPTRACTVIRSFAIKPGVGYPLPIQPAKNCVARKIRLQIRRKLGAGGLVSSNLIVQYVPVARLLRNDFYIGLFQDNQGILRDAVREKHAGANGAACSD